MKKIIFLYILTIIFIALMAILMSTPLEFLSFIKFPKWLHIILEGTNSVLMVLTFIVCNYMYSKEKNGRLLIISGGFLIGAIFNTIHLIAVNHFPFDFLSLANLENNPAMGYLLIGNLILPLSILGAFLHEPSEQHPKSFALKIYSFYFLLFIVLSLCPYLIYNFLPGLRIKFHIILHSLEFINYSLYIMLAFIAISIRQSRNIRFFPTFTTGLFISGLGGLFYLNISYIEANEILAHILQMIGLAFILAGVGKFLIYASYLRFKDELVAYLCLLVIIFYIGFISIISGLFHITLPPISTYLFVEFILILQFCIYLISNKITQPVTRIIDAINEYVPGEGIIQLPVIRNDEIGLLTNKVNGLSVLTTNKIKEIAKIVERENSIIKVFESLQRVSNQDILKHSIVEEVKNSINPDRAFIALYDYENDSFYIDNYINKLPSKTLMDLDEQKEEGAISTNLNEFLKNYLDLCFSNVNEYIITNSLEGTQREKILKGFGIKSSCSIPIYYSGHLLGCFVIQYTKEFVELDNIDMRYLKKITTQLGVVINNQKEIN